MERIFMKNKKILSILFTLIFAFGTVTAVPFVTGSAADLTGGDGDIDFEANIDSQIINRINALTALAGGDGDIDFEANIDSQIINRINALTALAGGDGDIDFEANVDSMIINRINALTGLSGGDGDIDFEANVDSMIINRINALTGLSGGDGDIDFEANVDSNTVYRLSPLTGLSGGDGDIDFEANVDSNIVYHPNPLITLSGGDGDIDFEANVESYIKNILLDIVTVIAEPEDGGTVTGGGEYNYGDEVTVTAAPAEGYRFVNWTENGTEVSTDADYTFTVTENRELTANFIPVYTVRFENYDGTELQTVTVDSGEIPSYSGDVPEKPDTDQYSYSFTGWDDGSGTVYPADSDLPAAQGDVTYTAVFTPDVNNYTVRFLNYDGTELQSSEMAYGEMPDYNGIKPEKPETDDYYYIFEGWAPEIETVTADADYTAYFSENEKGAIDLVAHSLTLGGDIGVNFYFRFADVTDDIYTQFTVDGKTVTVPISESREQLLDDGTTAYRFTCNVAAAQIGETITGRVYAGGNSLEFEYSVYDYLTELSEDPEYMQNADLESLARAVAVYGYYANELFGYYELAPHTLFDSSGMQDVTAQSLAQSEPVLSNTDGEINYVGSTLVLRTKTAIRHYFTLPEGKTIDNYTFALGEGESAEYLTPVLKGRYYYVEIPDIPSAELGDETTVTVLNGEDTAVSTWRYSALSYAYLVLGIYENGGTDVSAELADAVKALVLYYYSAAEYFRTHP